MTWKESNQDQKGFEILQDMGDDGFFQTDNTNFYTLITRKGNEILVAKGQQDISQNFQRGDEKSDCRIAEKNIESTVFLQGAGLTTCPFLF